MSDLIAGELFARGDLVMRRQPDRGPVIHGSPFGIVSVTPRTNSPNVKVVEFYNNTGEYWNKAFWQVVSIEDMEHLERHNAIDHGEHIRLSMKYPQRNSKP
jgi:hypothetical protein